MAEERRRAIGRSDPEMLEPRLVSRPFDSKEDTTQTDTPGEPNALSVSDQFSGAVDDGSRLQELLEWVKEQAEASDVLHDYAIKSDDRDAVISYANASQSFREVADRIHQLQANEEKGGEDG